MKVGIVGAGAIGLWLAGRLSNSGAAVSLLARGKSLETIQDSGVTVHAGENSLNARVKASDDAESLGPQDLLIFAVKGQDLPAAAESARALIDGNSLILPAMNGVPWWFLETAEGDMAQQALRSVDPEGKCAEYLPVNQVIGGVVHASCFVEQPGRVRHVMGNGLRQFARRTDIIFLVTSSVHRLIVRRIPGFTLT